MSRTLSVRILYAAVAVTSALALGACSGAANSSPSSGVSAIEPGAAGAQPPVGGEALSRTGADAPAAADAAKAAGGVVGAPAVVAGPKVIRTASVYLTVTSVDTAAAAVRGVATGLGGTVTSESINATETTPPADVMPVPKGGTTIRRGNYGQLVLAVPADKLDVALDQLSRLGTVVQRSSSSQDVTASYADTESRIATMKKSIERVRALMGQTQNIAQIVELEAQLTQREAELESLQAQLGAMAARVAMSSITVVISTDLQAVTPTEPDSGFVAGLKAGWKAFLASLTAILTVIGALLPWVLVLAIIGLPVLAWWRRRRAASENPASATSANPASAPAATAQQATTAPSGD